MPNKDSSRLLSEKGGFLDVESMYDKLPLSNRKNLLLGDGLGGAELGGALSAVCIDEENCCCNDCGRCML